jgi:hypothetical protein
MNAKMAMLMPMVTEISVALLEDTTLTSAKNWENYYAAWLKICTKAGYFLVALALCFGLFSALTGIKSGGKE